MSDRRIERDPFQCYGKQPFMSYEQAHKVAKRRRRSGHRFKKQHPYKCEICRRWHIGTSKYEQF